MGGEAGLGGEEKWPLPSCSVMYFRVQVNRRTSQPWFRLQNKCLRDFQLILGVLERS